MDIAPQPAHGVAEHLDALRDRASTMLKPRLRGVLHEAAFAISLITGTALVCLSPAGRPTVSAAVYAASVVLLFGTSAAYHRGRWGPGAHAVMMRLDHSMIFVLIAGTYTPFALVLLQGTLRWVVFGVVWGGALAGILARNTVAVPPRWVFTGLYLALGWVALGIIPQVLHDGGVAVLALLVAGGLFYSGGAVVYARQKPDPSPLWFGFHEVFHACTVAAFACHYVAIALVLLPA